MWTYEQATGELSNGQFSMQGFAGHDQGLNNPAMQEVHNVGPLPVGKYKLSEYYSRHPRVGLCAIELKSDSTNKMFGRADFFIHGASQMDPSHSSHGCIVTGNCSTRQAIWASNDRDLTVVARKENLT